MDRNRRMVSFHESPSSIIQMLQTMNVTISIASHKWIPIIVFLWVLSIFNFFVSFHFRINAINVSHMVLVIINNSGIVNSFPRLYCMSLQHNHHCSTYLQFTLTNFLLLFNWNKMVHICNNSQVCKKRSIIM